MSSFDLKVSYRLYGLLLFAYPPEFRRKFGYQMLQAFRDCCRAEANSGTLRNFWLRTLVDLVLTAARERADSSGREGVLMNNTRRDAMALLGCIGIIVIAFLLLNYGRKNDVSSILAFGYVLDALVTTGVVGNFVVFLLARNGNRDPFRIALWTFAVMHGVFLLLALMIGRTDPSFNLSGVLTGYVVSFLFWTGLHWARHKTGSRSRRQEQV